MSDLKECREAFEAVVYKQLLQGSFYDERIEMYEPIVMDRDTVNNNNRLNERWIGFKAAWSHRPKEEKLREALEEIQKRAMFQMGKDPGDDTPFIVDIEIICRQALSEEGGE